MNSLKTFYFLIDILARLVVVKRGFTCLSRCSGTYKKSGLLDAENLLDEKDLIAQDIVVDAFENTSKRFDRSECLDFHKMLISQVLNSGS